jgi:hypothetical protein
VLWLSYWMSLIFCTFSVCISVNALVSSSGHCIDAILFSHIALGILCFSYNIKVEGGYWDQRMSQISGRKCWLNTGACVVPRAPHIIFLLVIMLHTSGLSPYSPTLLENLFTFFTNTHHPLQCYHLSFLQSWTVYFHTSNTALNLDVAPRLPVCHIIT